MTITSFGVILFTVENGKKHFLIGQRMDTLVFLDMFNTRCPIDKVESYVYKCNDFEREKLIANNYNDIFADSFANHRDYEEFVNRWFKIKTYIEKALKTGIIHKTSCMYSLPKGKKKFGETQEEAAIREFEEETQLSSNLITKAYYPPYINCFKGSDDKLYKTVYYVYKCEEKLPIVKKPRKSPYAHRQFSVSEEMENLFWVCVDDVDNYVEENIAAILKSI